MFPYRTPTAYKSYCHKQPCKGVQSTLSIKVIPRTTAKRGEGGGKGKGKGKGEIMRWGKEGRWVGAASLRHGLRGMDAPVNYRDGWWYHPHWGWVMETRLREIVYVASCDFYNELSRIYTLETRLHYLLVKTCEHFRLLAGGDEINR